MEALRAELSRYDESALLKVERLVMKEKRSGVHNVRLFVYRNDSAA